MLFFLVPFIQTLLHFRGKYCTFERLPTVVLLLLTPIKIECNLYGVKLLQTFVKSTVTLNKSK